MINKQIGKWGDVAQAVCPRNFTGHECGWHGR